MSLKITESGGRLVATDTPRVIWSLGLVFVASGIFVLTSAPLSAEWATFAFWERAAVLAIGVAHLGGGLWFIRAHPSVRTAIDLTRRTGEHRIRRPGERRATVTHFSLADVREVDLVRDKDSDGDPVYGVRLILTDGRELRLQSFLRPGEAEASERTAVIRRIVGLPALPPARR
jgi:hypothetical protein